MKGESEGGNGYWTLCSSCMWMDVCMSMWKKKKKARGRAVEAVVAAAAEKDKSKSSRGARTEEGGKSSILCILPL